MIIYKITDKINGMVYIGQTTKTLEERIKQHKHTKNSLIGKAIRNHGLDHFDSEIIEHCKSLKELKERERFWIANFNCKYPNGYNGSDGGEGIRGFSNKIIKKTVKINENNKLNVEIGGRIRLIREAQGKTRDKLSEEADISPHFLFEIETGKKSMTANTIINLARALNVTTDFLLLGAVSPMSRIVNNLEGLPPDKLSLAEKFLEDFSSGARKNINNSKSDMK